MVTDFTPARAAIASGAVVNAQWLTVEALMSDDDGDVTGTIASEAISGASGGKVGIAGSLALNVVDHKSLAEVRGNAVVTLAGGDVRLAAEGNSASTVDAVALASSSGGAKTAAASNEAAVAPVTAQTGIGTAPGKSPRRSRGPAGTT